MVQRVYFALGVFIGRRTISTGKGAEHTVEGTIFFDHKNDVFDRIRFYGSRCGSILRDRNRAKAEYEYQNCCSEPDSRHFRGSKPAPQEIIMILQLLVHTATFHKNRSYLKLKHK